VHLLGQPPAERLQLGVGGGLGDDAGAERLAHGVVAFVFNAARLALTVNIAASAI